MHVFGPCLWVGTGPNASAASAGVGVSG